jgi:hypothetical protein
LRSCPNRGPKTTPQIRPPDAPSARGLRSCSQVLYTLYLVYPMPKHTPRMTRHSTPIPCSCLHSTCTTSHADPGHPTAGSQGPGYSTPGCYPHAIYLAHLRLYNPTLNQGCMPSCYLHVRYPICHATLRYSIPRDILYYLPCRSIARALHPTLIPCYSTEDTYHLLCTPERPLSRPLQAATNPRERRRGVHVSHPGPRSIHGLMVLHPLHPTLRRISHAKGTIHHVQGIVGIHPYTLHPHLMDRMHTGCYHV